MFVINGHNFFDHSPNKQTKINFSDIKVLLNEIEKVKLNVFHGIAINFQFSTKRLRLNVIQLTFPKKNSSFCLVSHKQLIVRSIALRSTFSFYQIYRTYYGQTIISIKVA